MSPQLPSDSLALPGGGRMPLLGFGTWQLKESAAFDATLTALHTGYRHLDTATMYANEAEVGAALKASGVDRDKVFVTTKFLADRAGAEQIAITQSLELLGVDYVDLWLIHWPPAPESAAAVWSEFCKARERGVARDIGVSNYSLDQLDQAAEATGVMPAVNQIKWSPLLFDEAVLRGHRERGVVLEGYSALRGGTLENPVLSAIAERLEKTMAQVIVRWHLQHDIVVIPKSAQPERIASNGAVADFTLNSEDMSAIDALGLG